MTSMVKWEEGDTAMRKIIVAKIVFSLSFVCFLLFSFGTRFAEADTAHIKIAWLQYPADWNCDEPGARVNLQTNPLKPSDWDIEWNTIDVQTASEEDFLQYGLIVISGHSSYSFTPEENGKLKHFLDNRGTIWVDNCGGLQLSNFILSVEFSNYEVQYMGQDIIVPNHPLIDGVYTLSSAEVNALGEGATGNSNLIVDKDPSYKELIREHATGEPLTLTYESTTGRIVITAQDVLCAIESVETEDLKFAYNVIGWSMVPFLQAAISPVSATIIIGQSILFSSSVSGGFPPYSYQWYLNNNPVSGATASSWAFTPTSTGNYYICLNVTDAQDTSAQTQVAQITVIITPVGGYSISTTYKTTTDPSVLYLATFVTLTLFCVNIRRKTTKRTN